MQITEVFILGILKTFAQTVDVSHISLILNNILHQVLAYSLCRQEKQVVWQTAKT